jgi:hypothetical protein
MMLLKKNLLKGTLILMMGITIVSCAGPKVSRVGTDTVTDLSGRWNDTDSRLVAEEMVKEALLRPWIGEATHRYSRHCAEQKP